MRQEVLSWPEVEKLVDVLLPQFRGVFDAMVMITTGGVVPGGLLSEVLGIKQVLTASVDFPPSDISAPKLVAWPEFLQFPEGRLVAGRRVLVVDDVWGSGRTITAVKGRVEAAGGTPELCVFHYNPTRTLFSRNRPDYYAAITDAYIVYPWEVERGRPHGVRIVEPETN
jgi:uncharacterized protein